MKKIQEAIYFQRLLYINVTPQIIPTFLFMMVEKVFLHNYLIEGIRIRDFHENSVIFILR